MTFMQTRGWRLLTATALFLLGNYTLLAAPALAQARGANGWRLFGYESEWSGKTPYELDSDRWSVITAPLGQRDAIGGSMVQQIANGIRKVHRLQQLRLVNSYYNNKPYEDDAKLFGVEDRWQYAEEFVRRGGDCEDFVVAKYRTLVAAGFPERDLRIVLLEDRVTRTDHAVLAAKVGPHLYILDNQRVQMKPDTYVTTYRPLYAFNRWDVYFYPSEKPRKALPDVMVTTRAR
jgi:predicted transglutaminase-like cysteine proteinase